MKKILYFTAGWCTHCKTLKPLINQAKLQGVLVEEFNVDLAQAAGLTQKYSVRSLPTLVLLEGDREVKRQVGTFPQNNVDTIVNWYNNA